MAAEKNLETTKGKAKGNDFLVLDVLSNKHRSSIVRDNCLLFHPRASSPEEDISLIRAKEKVQAALAETRRLIDLEEAARKATKEGAMVAVDLDMGTSTSAAPEDISALNVLRVQGNRASIWQRMLRRRWRVLPFLLEGPSAYVPRVGGLC
jgi:hypothetical protein